MDALDSHEEQMKGQVQRQRAKVQEGRNKAPELGVSLARMPVLGHTWRLPMADFHEKYS